MTPRRKHPLVPILIVGALAAWFFLTNEPRGTVEVWLAERGVSFSGDSNSEGLEVLETSATPAFQGTRLIRGSVRNTSERHYRVVRVIFELLDADGKPVDQVARYVSRLGPGDRRAFEVSAHGAGFSDFRVKEVKGW